MREPCREGHDVCEGGTLHIRARCETGCPQFQDGSWMSRDFCVRRGVAHPGLPLGEGDAAVAKAWIEAHFDRALR
jgi:hypothetical protein